MGEHASVLGCVAHCIARSRRGIRAAQPEASQLNFVEFKLKAPKAKRVELVGDFNHWKTGTLPLQRSEGIWQIMLPLPKGRYHYNFVIDGSMTPDGAEVRTVP